MRMQDLPYFCWPHRRRKVSSPQPTFGLSFVIARSKATKQSILSFYGSMDCLAEPVIGRRFAPTRWLAMTV
jgi:hypothetical protein